MKVEHVGFQVPDPVAMAKWYTEHLGLRVARSSGAPVFCHFMADDHGTVMFEIYNNSQAPIPDYRSMDPLVLHLAFVAKDVPGTRARLIAAGAAPEGEVTVLDSGDQLAMLRDPWGIAIQLARRKSPMINY